MNKKMIFTSILFLFPFGLSATEHPDTLELDLDKVIQIALDKNPKIKIANKEITLKKVANKETWQRLLPETSINGRIDHTIQAAEMKLNNMKFKMGEDGTNSINTTFTVSLPIFAPSLYKAMKISQKDIELSIEKARGTHQDLINQVTKAYYQLLLAQDSYEVMQKSYQLAKDNYHIVSAKFTQGKVSEFDKISAEVQLRNTKPNLVSASNAVALSALQLKMLMGISEPEIRLNDNLSNYENEVKQLFNKDENTSLSNNSTLKQLDINRDILEKNIKLQKMNLVPTLGMSFSYQYQSIYNKDMNLFKFDWAGSSSLLFNISIPLYRASNFTKIRTSRLQLEQLELSRVDTERKINMEIKNYQNNMVSSTEQVLSNRKNIQQAQKAVKIATKRYEVGRGTILELNSSQVSLTQAELVYNQSIYDYLIAKSDLEKTLGIEYVKK